MNTSPKTKRPNWIWPRTCFVDDFSCGLCEGVRQQTMHGRSVCLPARLLPLQPRKNIPSARCGIIRRIVHTTERVGRLLIAMRDSRPDVELILQGRRFCPCTYRRHYADFRYEPARSQPVLELMRQCDVLALPSLVEGRAPSTEALSCGLPFSLRRTRADDLIEPGTGFLSHSPT